MADRVKRFRITVLEPIREKDNSGQPIYTYRELHRDLPAHFEEKTGYEGGDERKGELGQTAAVAEVMFSVRYHPLLQITNKHRIAFNGRNYGVVHVAPRERKVGEGGFKELEIFCKYDQNAR